MRTLLALAFWLPAAAAAQVRTSDASLAGSAGAAIGYVADVGWSGPAIGAEIAARYVGGSAALTFPSDVTARAFSLAALVYPAGCLAPVTVALGVEYDLIAGGGRSTSFVGPVATVSYRLVHSPGGSVIPEARAGVLIPTDVDSRRNSGVQIGATARVTLATESAVRGVRVYVAPAVSRSVNLDSDGATYAASVEAGHTTDL